MAEIPEQVQPPTKKAGNPNWTPGMRSPNPSGRPRGVIDRRHRITQILMQDAEAVAKVVVEAAKEGSPAAQAMVLARVAPVLKSESERVEFPFDATVPLTDQVQSVLQAIADGKVSVDVGRQIIDAIASLAGIKQVDELEARIERLERRA